METGNKNKQKEPQAPSFFFSFKERIISTFQKVDEYFRLKLQEPRRNESIVAFRQLICAKINRENRDEFISVLQALGFKDITSREFLSKRRSSLMFSKVLANEFRLHLRLYEVGQEYFILAHVEPLPSNNLRFHVQGFFRQIQGKFRRNEELPSQEPPSPSDSQEDFRIELADYEAGGDHLKRIITAVPTFEKKVDFSITEEDLRLFTAIYGTIDHIPTITLILENFLESAGKNFLGGVRSLPKILEIFGFQVSPVDGKYEKGYGFLAKAIYADAHYSVLIRAAVGTPLAEVESLNTNISKVHADYMLIILPNEEFAEDLEMIAKKARVNIISASNLGLFFLDHSDYPFTQKEIEAIFSSDGGIIPLTRINELIAKKKGFEQIFALSRKILDHLQQAGRWVSLKEVEKTCGVPEMVRHETVTYILNFLTNPLIGVVEEQKGKSFRAILNKEEIQLKLMKLEELLKNIRPRKTIL